ncbi:MAG: AAA family ATPase [Verrucomicrobiota bacterium]
MTEIIFLNGPCQKRRVEIPSEGIYLGSNPDCAAVVDDAAVSAVHAQIVPDPAGWAIFDLQSASGTIVNDQRIEAALLSNGDTIKLGEIVLQFATQSAGVEASSAPASVPAAAPSDTLEATDADLALVRAMGQRAGLIRQEIGKVIVGQFNVVEEILMAMIGGGHALLIGMPGMAKTLMVSTIAKVFNLDFRRVQFTPDLMPSDITGTELLETNRETGEREFRFIRGPIFCNLLLADEINRTPPKTQAALLEAMQEHRVTVGNQTYSLGEPFFVLATQNPIEQEGTYPLPEAQLDRFMFNIWVDYPSAEEEEIIVEATTRSTKAKAEAVLTKQEVLQLQEVVRKIPVSRHVIKYATQLVRSTRPSAPEAPDFVKEYIQTGAGPRASQVMIMAAKARAVMEGRIHVSCSDIRKAALPVLRHRILTNFAADSEGLNSVHLIERLLKHLKEPSEKDYPSVAQKKA